MMTSNSCWSFSSSSFFLFCALSYCCFYSFKIVLRLFLLFFTAESSGGIYSITYKSTPGASVCSSNRFIPLLFFFLLVSSRCDSVCSKLGSIKELGYYLSLKKLGFFWNWTSDWFISILFWYYSYVLIWCYFIPSTVVLECPSCFSSAFSILS